MRKALLFLLALSFLAAPALAEDFVCAEEEETCAIGEPTGLAATKTASALEDHGDKICVVYFYGEECSNCQTIKPFIEGIQEKYEDTIHIDELEIYHNLNNYQSYNKLCGIQGIPIERRGVPFIAIGDTYLMGSGQIRTGLEPKILEMITAGDRTCPLEGEMACHRIEYDEDDVSLAIPDLKESVTLPLVITAGLIDGINPCAFAVLIFLLTYLITISDDKRRMLKAGFAYTGSVYVTYLLAGLGLFSAIQISGMSALIVKVAAVVAILAGLVNIKDYFWYGKGLTLRIPPSKKPMIMAYARKANVPAAIVLGFLVLMFELPCTGGVYLAILAMLANSMTRLGALPYLLIYNLMFILPLIVIIGLVRHEMTVEHIKNWKETHKNKMKLGMGLLLILLGVGMLLGWF